MAETRQFLESVKDGSLSITPQDATLVGGAAQAAADIGGQFFNRAWIVCHTTRIMVTCDEPVVTVGGPGHERGQRAGFESAGVILFPLGPEHVLVLMRDDLALSHGISEHRDGLVIYDELDNAETREICREIAMNTYRWAFERPSKRTVARFAVPPRAEPGAIEDCGPVADGAREGTLVRFYVPNRWAKTWPADWPVGKWWA